MIDNYLYHYGVRASGCCPLPADPLGSLLSEGGTSQRGRIRSSCSVWRSAGSARSLRGHATARGVGRMCDRIADLGGRDSLQHVDTSGLSLRNVTHRQRNRKPDGRRRTELLNAGAEAKADSKAFGRLRSQLAEVTALGLRTRTDRAEVRSVEGTDRRDWPRRPDLPVVREVSYQTRAAASFRAWQTAAAIRALPARLASYAAPAESLPGCAGRG